MDNLKGPSMDTPKNGYTSTGYVYDMCMTVRILGT